LLWQLYLLVPGKDRNDIKSTIRKVNVVVDEIRQVRYAAANEPDDDKRPKPRTKKQQDQQDDQDDILRRDYGQGDIYRRVHSLAQDGRWKDLVL
jgi:hypothetical protein